VSESHYSQELPTDVYIIGPECRPEAQGIGYLLLGLAIAYLVVVILIIGLSFEIYFGHSETVINMLISTITPDPESHSKFAPLVSHFIPDQ
jgi:hypothetical protein